jgi:hypothetical protein
MGPLERVPSGPNPVWSSYQTIILLPGQSACASEMARIRRNLAEEEFTTENTETTEEKKKGPEFHFYLRLCFPLWSLCSLW